MREDLYVLQIIWKKVRFYIYLTRLSFKIKCQKYFSSRHFNLNVFLADVYNSFTMVGC